MLGGIQKYVMFGLMISLVLLMSVSYWYYSHSQQQITTLRENTGRLETAVQTQQAAIQAQQQALENQHREMSDLNTRMFRADSQRRDLEVQLRRLNLESRARENHADLTRRMNEATVRMFTQMEQVTGAAPATGTATQPESRPHTSDPNHPQPPPRPPQRRSP
jgi:chromosome segregation ATPase